MPDFPDSNGKTDTVTPSYIGQVENGTTRCRREFATQLDKAMDSGTTMADAWDDLLKNSRYPPWFADYRWPKGTASLLPGLRDDVRLRPLPNRGLHPRIAAG